MFLEWSLVSRLEIFSVSAHDYSTLSLSEASLISSQLEIKLHTHTIRGMIDFH